MPPNWPSDAAWKSCTSGRMGSAAAEHLVAAIVLRWPELRLAERPFQGGKEVRNGLRVVPHVRTRTGAAAKAVFAAFPGPQPAVGLAEHRGRLEDREVGRHGLDHFRRQRAVVEAIAEALRFYTQGVVLLPPVGGQFLDAGKAARIPGPMRTLFRHCAWLRRRLAFVQVRLAGVPGQAEHDCRRLARGDRQGHEKRGAGRRAAFTDRRAIEAGPFGHVFPGHGQGIEPAAAEPGAINTGGPVAHRGRDCQFFPGSRLSAATPESEAAGRGLHGLRVRAQRREVPGAEGEDGLDRRRGGVRETVFQAGQRQARGVGVARLEGAPGGQFDLQRDLAIGKLHRGEGKTDIEDGRAEPRQAERRAARAGAAVRRAEQFPTRYGALQHAGNLLRALDGDSRKRAGLVENLRPVAEREMRQRAAAFQADHARAQPAQRKSHPIEMHVAVLRVVGATAKRGGRCGLLADGRRCGGGDRRAGDTARSDGAHGGGRDFEKIAALQRGIVFSVMRHVRFLMAYA